MKFERRLSWAGSSQQRFSNLDTEDSLGEEVVPEWRDFHCEVWGGM